MVLRELVVGSWDLVSWTITRGDGDVVNPFGPDLVGQLMYGADGRVSVHLIVPGAAAFASDDLAAATEKERADAWTHYLGYWGTYRVDEDAQVIVHDITGSSFPNLAGRAQVRRCIPDGAGGFVLTADEGWGHVEITWRPAAGFQASITSST